MTVWEAPGALPDQSTAGPSGSAALCGPRRGLAFLTQPEPSPDPHLQPSPLGYMVGGVHMTDDYAQNGVGQ